MTIRNDWKRNTEPHGVVGVMSDEQFYLQIEKLEKGRYTDWLAGDLNTGEVGKVLIADENGDFHAVYRTDERKRQAAEYWNASPADTELVAA